MSDHPEPPGTMTVEEVDEKLAAMGRAADVLLREWEEATRAVEEANAVSEGRIERAQHSKEPYSPFDAESVLASVRLRLAVDSDKEHRHAAREFVCWWVDAAVTAWRSAALGVPLSPTRWGAVAPQTLMFKEELALLPRADEHARTIVELGLAMGGPRSEIGELSPDPVALALDEAKRSGLRVRRNTEGEIEVVDGDEPEERRRRMWGDYWIRHRMPLLPDADELDRLFARTPDAPAHRLRAALKSVVEAVMAKERIDELNDAEGPWSKDEMAEYERLDALSDELTHRLAEYARSLTSVLPEVRTVNA
ncbi:hypothetical protein [Streptomyces acidiscabies]|uniref:hypothetical protein n=1 Tax=Streptomyces acidiscabies TaxID=42234 RepID=UPI000951C8C3|nr:hypothetical protein [Streptomyces acidiscabies]